MKYKQVLHGEESNSAQIPCQKKPSNAIARFLTPLLIALAIPCQLSAAGPAPLNLLSNTNFVVLAETTITTTGGGSINGNVGLSGTGTGIHVTCAQVTGTIYAVDATGPGCAVDNPTLVNQAVSDMLTSYTDAANRVPVPTGTNLNPGAAFSTGYDIGGLTLAPGLYKFGSGQTAFINTDVTLSGGPGDVWIFQCGADLEVATGVHIILTGGAQAGNIFWQVSTKAVLDTTSVFNGTILAGTSIVMNTGSTMNGRALAQAAVTYNGSGAVLSVLQPGIVVQQPLGTNLTNGVGTNDFGSVAVGATNSLTFTITNVGSADLTGLGITIDGANSAMFSVITNPIAPVGPGSNTTFTVSFAPVSAGVKIAALHIASNDTNNNPFNINLTGTGITPIIVVQQSLGTNLTNGVGTNDFGSVAVGATNSLTFTITNVGSANLIISGITNGGPDAASFTESYLVATLSPGGITNFTVNFAPTNTGVKNATLYIASNDTNNNPYTIALTGTGTNGTVPIIGVQQPLGTSLTNGVGTNNFGSVVVGGTNSLTFTITNRGTSNLTISGITNDGPDAAIFTVTNLIFTVSPGGSTNITVSFAPTNTGVKIAALHIVSNATNNPFNINLTGTGTNAAAPVIVVQQPLGNSLTNGVGTNNFGSLAVGTNTSLTFTITNRGTANLTISGITNNGTDAASFTVTNLVATLSPGGSTNITVSFAPVSAGVKIAALHIASNDTNNNAFNINLTGTGTNAAAPIIGVQQPLGTNLTNGVGTNNFGSVVVGGTNSLTFTITNVGSANLIISGITNGGPDAASFTESYLVATLSPGGITNFTVNFAPTNTGVKNATLYIASNDTNNNPYTIALTGTGTNGTVPIIGVQQPLGTSLTNGVGTNNFGSVVVGGTNSLTFTITNRGTSNLTISGITNDGPDAAIFTVTNLIFTVSPGGSTNITVSFAPTNTGVKIAALHIVSNATNNPFNINLTGTGTNAAAPVIVVQQPLGNSLTNGVGTNNFGSLAVGTNTSLTFTITNRGTANLTISGITNDGADAVMFAVTNNPAVLVIPGGSTTFTVRFAPFSAGVKAAVLHIASNDTNNNPFNINLTGTGTNGIIVVSTNVFVMTTSLVMMNPQSALFTNSIVVTNGGLTTVAAVRLLILNLPADVVVYSPSGTTTNGTPYMQYNFPMAPGARVGFWIEYYRASRLPFPAPTYVVQELTNAVTQTTTNGVNVAIDKILMINGTILVEFYATPGRTYAVQYSTNMINWFTANPFIVASANYVQWYDQGPPETEPLTANRFYHVFEMP